MYYLRLVILFGLLFFMIPGLSVSQPTKMNMRKIHNNAFWLTLTSVQTAEIEKFMQATGYGYIWIDSQNPDRRDQLIILLEKSETQGLEERKYQFDFIQAFRKRSVLLQNEDDSIISELKFTNAALEYFKDLAYGQKPILGYEGLEYSPSCNSIPILLAEYAKKDSLMELQVRLSVNLPEVAAILEKLNSYLIMINRRDYSEETITSTKLSTENLALRKKLFYLGFIDSVQQKLTENTVRHIVIKAQLQFNLFPDGKLNSSTLRELNIDLSSRIKQLKYAIAFYRWLTCHSKDGPVIIVNIPAAYLKVYEGTSVIMQMKMVVGHPSTPTPTLSSKVKEVVLYPYWMVPRSITVKELLPAIKRDRGYLDRNGFQVIDKKGNVVDHNRIVWSTISATNFPFMIRQSTGCDNSLGLLKLNFDNPYSVYLHDTPHKTTFLLNRRFYSHGCMRLENPMELGHLILKNNPVAIDTLEAKGCLRNQSPIVVHADLHLPVIIWYNPVGLDALNNLVYYEDVYKRFSWAKKKSEQLAR